MMNLCGRLHAALQASTARPRGVKLNACFDEVVCIYPSSLVLFLQNSRTHTHCGLYFHSFTISETQQTNEPFVVVVRRSPSGSLVHIYGTCDLVVRVRASAQLVMSVQSYDQGFKGQVHLKI